MEQKQLTQEELANVTKLANSLTEIASKFGQIKIEKLNLITQLNAVDQLEQDLDKQYLELKEKEYILSKDLSEKYGDGILNLETGTIS